MAKIECKISDDLTIVLSGVDKISGHDDSTPFMADIYLKSEKLGLPKLTRVGHAYNDGWGGDTEIESAQYAAVLEKLNEHLKQNYQIHIKKPDISWEVRLDYLVSIMAERSIYGHQTKMNITDVEDCEKVAPLQYPTIEGQKYTYAECLTQTPIDTKEVMVALAPRDKLGIKKGSAVDKTIYHYFNGYEDFLEQLVKDPVFTSTDDFNIKSVLKLK